MVAALRVDRHGPVSRSAALRKIAARSSNDIRCQAGAADFAAATACRTSARGGVRQRAESGGGVVRLHDVDAVAAAEPVLAADRHGQLDPLGRHLLELGREFLALRASRPEVVDRLVDRQGGRVMASNVKLLGCAEDAEGGEGCESIGTCAGQPPTSERAKKRRFAGRSAIRRIRYGYQDEPNGMYTRTR